MPLGFKFTYYYYLSDGASKHTTNKTINTKELERVTKRTVRRGREGRHGRVGSEQKVERHMNEERIGLYKAN